MDTNLNVCPLCKREAEFAILEQEKCFDCATCGSFRMALEAEGKLRHLMAGVRRIWSQMSQAAPADHCLAIAIADDASPRRAVFGLDARYRMLNERSGHAQMPALSGARPGRPRRTGPEH
jgi:hypothetical protein